MMKKVILFIIFYLAFCTLNLYAMDAYLLNLPVPPDTDIIYEDLPAQINYAKVNTIHLCSDLKKDEIVSFYKTALAKSGFQLHNEAKEQGALSFIKDGQFVYIIVQESMPELACNIYIISSTEDISPEKLFKEELNKAQEEIKLDVSGKDSLDIPRYPGSRRRMNMFAPNDSEVVMYEASAKPSDIAGFYKNQLKTGGWELTSAYNPEKAQQVYQYIDKEFQAPKGIEMMQFAKGNEQLTVTISPFLNPDGHISLITVSKNIEKLVQGER